MNVASVDIGRHDAMNVSSLSASFSRGRFQQDSISNNSFASSSTLQKYPCSKKVDMTLTQEDETKTGSILCQPPSACIMQKLRHLLPDGCTPQSISALKDSHLPFFWCPKKQRIFYDMDAINAVNCQNIETLKQWHQNGRPLETSNEFGESLVHLACKRGSLDVLKFLVREAGASLWVHDRRGRTPLHLLCRSTDDTVFQLFKFIIEQDSDLLYVADARGCTPLDNVPREMWNDWILFLESLNSCDFMPNREIFLSRAPVRSPVFSSSKSQQSEVGLQNNWRFGNAEEEPIIESINSNLENNNDSSLTLGDGDLMLSKDTQCNGKKLFGCNVTNSIHGQIISSSIEATALLGFSDKNTGNPKFSNEDTSKIKFPNHLSPDDSISIHKDSNKTKEVPSSSTECFPFHDGLRNMHDQSMNNNLELKRASLDNLYKECEFESILETLTLDSTVLNHVHCICSKSGVTSHNCYLQLQFARVHPTEFSSRRYSRRFKSVVSKLRRTKATT